jgi:hypothetical protein
METFNFQRSTFPPLADPPKAENIERQQEFIHLIEGWTLNVSCFLNLELMHHE